MEPVRQLFSRGASPTPSVSLSSFAAADVDPAVHHSPAASIRSHGAGGSIGQASGAATSPQSRVEALFANMTPPNAPPTSNSTMTNAGNNNANHSGAGTPVSVANQSVHSATSDSNSRANALLSLLSPGPAQAPMPQATPPQPPAPENAGRMLLEQLMGGSGGTRAFVPPAVTGLAAHYPPSPYPPMSSNYYDPVPPPMPVQPAPQPEPVQSPPSPPKSMFDFVSPFDALGPAPASAGSNKVSPEPPSSAGITSSLTDAPPAWADPKRKSVDNLLEQLTRSTVPNAPIPPVQQDDPEAQLATANKSQSQGRPLPPKPQGQQGSPRVTQLHAQGSPRASPPKQSAVARARQVESPSGPAGSQREKDESPGPRGQGWKNRGKKNGTSAISNNIISNAPASPGQSLALDMSLPLEEIRVPEGSSATVPIALVKMDEAFAPGTTIGATAWIAYAMSKGRVRIISRASGERTLLQLPECFNYPTNIVDVAVHGHRIAVVTQDGGLVVWEMPEIIADDVPGRIIVCVLPQTGPDALRLVKWHTHDPDTLAVASSRSVYTLHVPELDRLYSGQLVEQAELARAVPPLYPTEHSSSVEPIPKIAALEFVPAHAALTVLLDDGTLSYYVHSPASRGGPSTTAPTPFHTTRIPPPASVGAITAPCSLTAAGGALVLGRAQNTSLQILGAPGRGVLATIRFTLPSEPASFVRLSFEPRARVLWAAHSKRAGLWAIRLGPAVDGEGYGFGGEAGAIVQVAEFPVKTPVLDLVALAPPEGENAEAAAACHAAKVPPGPVALVAFVQHVTGVDQVVIRGDWWAAALAGTREKLPYTASSVPSGNAPLGSSTMSSQPLPPQVPMQAQSQVQVPLQASSVQQTPTRETRRERAERERVERETAHIAQPSPVGAPARVRTPEDEPEAAPIQSSSSTQQDGPRGRGGKGKGVSKPQERERERKKDDDKESGKENSELSRELKKLEEALHLRVARHVTRELERQHAWLADVRAADKDDAMRYQSMLLDAVSNELTKNTTALFDTAVRAEVRNGVLPLLEDVVRAEVARGVGKQVAAGVSDSVNKTLPPEIERLLVRPDVSAHVARTFSQTVSPLIERHVKDAITHTLVPTYTAQTSALHEALAREMQAEMLALRKEVIAWQSDALRSHEGALRELEGTVRALSDQIRALAPLQQRPPPQQTQQQQQYAPPSQPPPPPHGQPQYAPPPPPQQLHQQYGPPPQQMQQMQPAWFPPQSLPAPQASHPAVPPPAHHSPPLSNAVGQAPDPDGWDETYMNVLQSQDARALRELLARSPPDALMPLSPNAPSPLSQVVLLSLVHRLATGLNEMAPEGEAFQGNLWWLRRAAGKLNAEDVTIKPYAARVLPGVQSGLGVLRTRIGLLPPGVGVQDASRAVGEVAELIGRKVQ